MKRFLLSFFLVFILVINVLPVSAVSLNTGMFEPYTFVDSNNVLHQYFWVNNASQGLFIEVVSPSVNIILNSNDISIRFVNNSSFTRNCRITIYKLSNGLPLFSYYEDVPSNSNSGYFNVFDDVLYGINQNDIDFIKSTYLSSTSFSYLGESSSTFTISSNSSISYDSIPVVFTERTKDGIVLSNLSQPVADNYNSYFVLTRNTYGYLYQITWFPPDLTSDYSLRLYCDSTGKFHIEFPRFSEVGYDAHINVFDLSSGNFITSNFIQVSAGATFYRVGLSNLTAFTISDLITYGIAFDNQSEYDFGYARVAWSTDLQQTTTLTLALNLIRSQLISVNREMEVISDLLNSFYIQNSMTLDSIYDLLYEYLKPDEVPTFVEPTTESLQNFLDSESKVFDSIDPDYYDKSVSLFDNNNITNGTTFQLLRSIMNTLIFNNNKLSSLVIFSLTIGLAVLILGRKLNA